MFGLPNDEKYEFEINLTSDGNQKRLSDMRNKSLHSTLVQPLP